MSHFLPKVYHACNGNPHPEQLCRDSGELPGSRHQRRGGSLGRHVARHCRRLPGCLHGDPATCRPQQASDAHHLQCCAPDRERHDWSGGLYFSRQNRASGTAGGNLGREAGVDGRGEEPLRSYLLLGCCDQARVDVLRLISDLSTFSRRITSSCVPDFSIVPDAWGLNRVIEHLGFLGPIEACLRRGGLSITRIAYLLPSGVHIEVYTAYSTPRKGSGSVTPYFHLLCASDLIQDESLSVAQRCAERATELIFLSSVFAREEGDYIIDDEEAKASSKSLITLFYSARTPRLQ